MPEKLFYNTGAPGAILVFNKNKPDKRKKKVFFVNASEEYEQHPEVRKLNRLGEENQKKIADAYKNFKEIEGFSRAVEIEEIEENDFNLNVTLYVYPEEEIEKIDIQKEWKELNEIEEEIKLSDQNYNESEDKFSKEKEVLNQRKKELEEEKEKRTNEKNELTPNIPSDQVNLYLKIFDKKSRIALSLVKDDFCSLCHMRIRPQVLNELKEKKEIYLCENCGRILYWPKSA